MKIEAIDHIQTDTHQIVTFSVSGVGDGPRAFHFRVPPGQALCPADCGVAASLFTAMRLRQPLQTDWPISARLAGALPTIQAIMAKWVPTLRVAEVEAPTAIRETDVSGVASFFTGGVDSFYTLLKHQDAIDTLIYVHGFDLLPDGHPHGGADPALREQVSASLAEVAQRLGKRLIEVESDLRLLSDAHLDWGMFHGAALAATALLLAPQFKRVYIPSSYAYDHLFPWGSHPLLDPLWSTEALAVVHDGCEATRTEKVAAIAGHPLVRELLRVCWENPGGAYNCGRCNKCVRTLVQWRLAGDPGPTPSFEAPLDVERVARVRFRAPSDRLFAAWSLSAAEAQGDRELARALRRSLHANDRRAALRPLIEAIRQLRATLRIRRPRRPAKAPPRA